MNLLELSQPFLGRGRRYVEGGPRHLLMYVFGRFHVIRCVIVWIYSLRQSKPLPTDAPTLVEKVDIDGAVRTLCQDGLFARLQLPKDVMQQLLTFHRSRLVMEMAKPIIPFATTTRRYSSESAYITTRSLLVPRSRLLLPAPSCPPLPATISTRKRTNAAGRCRKKVYDDSYSR